MNQRGNPGIDWIAGAGVREVKLILEEIAEEIRKKLGCKAKSREPMWRHTSFRIGGPAELYIEPRDEEELVKLLAYLREKGIPYLVMGNGTNLLVSDAGIEGAVVHLGDGFKEIRIDGSIIRAGAAAPLIRVAREAAGAGLSGLEFAGGIPGSLGGALYMNAGAHGGDISKVASRARVIHRESGRIEELASGALEFGYRSSLLRKRGYVALGAELVLARGGPEEIRARMDGYAKKRRATQPQGAPNAGSIFRNPPGQAAGRLIEEAGAKGMAVGGAEVSRVHANFIVNRGQATACDVLKLIERMQALVEERYGVKLEPEIEFVGRPC
ncbi:MAG: UDP-N-acetylmuramate dehydrogenase [Firmicutes bacterium]|nr:UDP-N-acetylmuramate dehydrogenase [Bacillota bacterium]